jgi:hypothetical protein
MEQEAESVSPSNPRTKSLLVEEVTKTFRTKFRQEHEVPKKAKFNMENFSSLFHLPSVEPTS